MHWLVTEVSVKCIVLDMQKKRFLFREGSLVLTGNLDDFEDALDNPEAW
jgi:hypothetical protein